MILVENPSDPHYVLPFQAHSQVPISCSIEHLPIAGVMGTLIHSMQYSDVTKKSKKKKASNQIFGSLHNRYVHALK